MIALSTTLKWLGFAITAAFAGFCGLIVVGYTLTDVGGWKAVGLIAAVAVPLVLLCLVAYHRPSVAVPLLAVAACVPIGFGVMQLLDYQRWSDWEDQTGPVSLVLVLLVAVPLAVLGLSRRPGGSCWPPRCSPSCWRRSVPERSGGDRCPSGCSSCRWWSRGCCSCSPAVSTQATKVSRVRGDSRTRSGEGKGFCAAGEPEPVSVTCRTFLTRCDSPPSATR